MTSTIGTTIRFLSLVAVLATSGMFGCARTLRVEQADAGEKVAVDSLLHDHLQKQPMVTVAEAYRAVLILAEGDDNYTDFDARRAALESRGITRPEWHLQREACIDRGSVAYMVCQIIKAPGGLNLNLVGRLTGAGDRRYAVRELAYLEIMEAAATYRYITGSELVDVLLKADRYMASHGMYEQQQVDIAETLQTRGATGRPASQAAQ
ncbi:MAG TPA: hypothetical protein VLM89_12155 [Phycisphaerae bacterium]|nr:hypothetical protein [Phycisphaerae bacterium]